MKIYKRPFYVFTGRMVISGFIRAALFYWPSFYLFDLFQGTKEFATIFAPVPMFILILLTNARYRFELEGSVLRYYKKRKLIGKYNLNLCRVRAAIHKEYSELIRTNTETGEKTSLGSDPTGNEYFNLYITEPSNNEITLNCDFLGKNQFESMCRDLGLISN